MKSSKVTKAVAFYVQAKKAQKKADAAYKKAETLYGRMTEEEKADYRAALDKKAQQ